jgi:hypothetical protein
LLKTMKYFVLVLACFFACFLAAFAASPPYRCNQLSLNISSNVSSSIAFLLSLDLQLTEIDGKTYVFYSNLSTVSEGMDYIDFLCIAHSDEEFCDNTTEPVTVIGNQTMSLWAHLGTHNTTIPLLDIWPIFATVVDENSFSMLNGKIFTPENPCSNDLEVYGIATGTQCCTSFKPVKQPSVNSRCKSFKSRTTIYNTDDNYSIYATSQVDYQLENETLAFEGSFSAYASELSIEYDNNGNFICFGNQSVTTNCNIPIPSPNSKMMLEMSTRNGTGISGTFTDMLVPIGRLLLRNGQALIEEGISFTPKNNCQYSSSVINPQQAVGSQFCCTSFE